MKLTERPRLHTPRLRIAPALAALCTSALLAGGVLASPAAASVAFTTHLEPDNTASLVLDISGDSGADGALLIDWLQDEGTNQVWTFEPVTNDINPSTPNTYEIINGNSQQCLDSNGIPGDQVYQEPCYGYASEQWTTNMNVNSSGMIENVSSGLYLDVYDNSEAEGDSIDTWYYNGNSNQWFTSLVSEVD